MKERLKLLRKQLGISQSDLAKRIGVTRSAVSRLESGDINFTEQMVKSICRELNVNYDWFKDGDGEMFEAIPDGLVDELSQEFDLDDLDRRIILGYLQLNDADRAVIKRYIQSLIDFKGQ